MDPRAEGFVARAKEALTNVHQALRRNPAHWRSCTQAVKTCMQYVDQSHIMHDPRRIEERVWIITEVQFFASNDPSDGGVREVSDWCEREWNRALHIDPYNVAILTGLGNLWLSKAQNVLARIDHQDGGRRVDSLTADRRAGTADYHEARTILQPAVDFLAQAVQVAQSQGRLTGELLEKRAEASMHFGNVSTTRAARQHFRDAIQALQAAVSVGYPLPRHLQQWLREYERY